MSTWLKIDDYTKSKWNETYALDDAYSERNRWYRIRLCVRRLTEIEKGRMFKIRFCESNSNCQTYYLLDFFFCLGFSYMQIKWYVFSVHSTKRKENNFESTVESCWSSLLFLHHTSTWNGRSSTTVKRFVVEKSIHGKITATRAKCS